MPGRGAGTRRTPACTSSATRPAAKTHSPAAATELLRPTAQLVDTNVMTGVHVAKWAHVRINELCTGNATFVFESLVNKSPDTE